MAESNKDEKLFKYFIQIYLHTSAEIEVCSVVEAGSLAIVCVKNTKFTIACLRL